MPAHRRGGEYFSVAGHAGLRRTKKSDDAPALTSKVRGLSPDLTKEQYTLMSRTILVIAESAELEQLFREVLSGAGYSVSYTHEQSFDLQAIEHERPALILFDLDPGQEARGWQRVQMLRLRRATATVPVLVSTMQRSLLEEIEGRLLTIGIGCILKPFTIEQLLQAVQQTLAMQPSVPPPAEPAA